MCLLATVGHCTCHNFQQHHNGVVATLHSPTFLTMFAFPSIFLSPQSRGITCLPGKKRGSPLILDWLDWAWRPKGSNPHPLKTGETNSNHNIANICFSLPKRWFETCSKRSSEAAAFSTAPAAKDHSFLWHVLWILAHHVYIYRDRVMTHAHGLLVLSRGLETVTLQCSLFLSVCRHFIVA